jgi:hypothetical protein
MFTAFKVIVLIIVIFVSLFLSLRQNMTLYENIALEIKNSHKKTLPSDCRELQCGEEYSIRLDFENAVVF